MNLPVNYVKLTTKQRKEVREKYIEMQEGKCSHCKELLSDNPPKVILNKWINLNLFPRGFFRWPIHLHHNHKTGMTIGAVHNYCNAILFQYYGE